MKPQDADPLTVSEDEPLLLAQPLTDLRPRLVCAEPSDSRHILAALVLAGMSGFVFGFVVGRL